MIDLLDQIPLPTLVVSGAVVCVAFAGGLLTQIGPWYENLRFPSWRPPNWLFGPAWTTIFLLVAIAAIKAWDRAPTDRARALLIALFAVNAVVNVAWSALFFRLRRPDWALVDVAALWLSIVALIGFCAGFSEQSAWLLAPYLAWVSFASYLNLVMVRLNAPFRTHPFFKNGRRRA